MNDNEKVIQDSVFDISITSERLHHYLKKHCEKFADANYAYYMRTRGVANRSDIYNTAYDGKLAECAVSSYLCGEKYYNTKFVDFRILTPDKKSFNADITFGRRLIHVKTQNNSSMNTYGMRGVFQFLESKDTLFDTRSEKDLICPSLCFNRNRVVVLGFFKAKDIFDNDDTGFRGYKYFSEMDVDKHKEKKMALRWRHIKDIQRVEIK